jgi:uncharacterized membrane protein
MFSDLEDAMLIISAVAAAMVARYYAVRFVRRRSFSRRRQQIYILTPMFAAMFLVLNGFWMSLSWPDMLAIPVITLFQIGFMIPIIIAFSLLPNPFWKETAKRDQESA